MTTRFKICQHGERKGSEMVEVWIDEKFVAAIYPGARDDELRVISKHLLAATIDDIDQPPVVNIILAIM